MPTLWYRQPAEKWAEALPIGNGRLGAMVFGGVPEEQLQLNEDTLWSGGPHCYDNPEAFEHLSEIRKLIAQGRFGEALEVGDRFMLGVPRNQQAYQPLGNLRIRYKGHEGFRDYRRGLDLQNAVVTVSYRVGHARFTREVFASYPDQVIVLRVACDKPGQLSFDVTMDSPHPSITEPRANHLLRMAGQVAEQPRSGLLGPWEGKGLNFEARLQVIAQGGSVKPGDACLEVRSADTVTLVYTAATSYKNYQDISGDPEVACQKALSTAATRSYEQLLSTHTGDHRSLFDRVDIDLGEKDASRQPTDVRVKAVRDGGNDPHLMAQSFQFGRYLLIASSRPGSQPANLQGIWNESTRPPWGSKWTLNINAQMNYWPAEVCNLAECHEPLLRLVEELRIPGRRTARVHYNCRGFVVHHNTDLWRGTAPVDGARWGLWPMGGAWLCRHLWEHYDFGRDRDFLKRAYATMKEAAEFFVDYLIEDESGHLVTCPAISFEQGFRMPDGTTGRLCMGPTMDTQILRDLFTHCIQASTILGVDPELRAQLNGLRSRLLPTRVNSQTGRLQEWRNGREPAGIGSGQLAHLWGLCPGNQITPRATPELAAAARKSLEYRELKLGSWCSGTRLNFRARLHDGEGAYDILRGHMSGHVMDNLLSNFSGSLFQIDGNLGVTAGIAEMLLQSHAGEIHVLPALPKAWPSGHVKGLRARGGFQIDIYWREGRLTETLVRSLLGNNCKVRSGDIAVELKTRVGESYQLDGSLKLTKADKGAEKAAAPIGESLQNSMIWTPSSAQQANRETSVAFRKQFNVPGKPAEARLHIFADSRYILWVNGEYVLRGPCRFNPKRPEYDSIDVRTFLKKGSNTLAVLVHGGLSNGRIMKHEPGLTVRLEIRDEYGHRLTVVTDDTWRVGTETKFLTPEARAGCIQDNIDATRERINWVSPEFNDSSWDVAVNINGGKWGPFHRRSIPLLRETDVCPSAIVQVKQDEATDNNPRSLPHALPFEIRAPAEMVIDIGRMAQAYWVLDFEADQASEFTIKPCQTFQENKRAENHFGIVNRYKARPGRQRYMSTDTYGFRYVLIELNSGRIRLLGAKFVERSYPFDRLGRFECSDAMLNELWEMAVRTVEVCSEDAYVDCALRERAEWMGDGAVVTYPISRVAFATHSEGGTYIYSDPRLIRNMLRHIALSQFEDGRIKANACSDGGDMHAYIEDYACLWVQALRQYYENTGDTDFVREVWPVLVRQMKWFLDRRTERGLVRAREFLLHMDNPLHHQQDCEGATLNAFIYRALMDSAYLAKVLGERHQADEYDAAAARLAYGFNGYLWNTKSRTYYAGIKQGQKIPPNRWLNDITNAYWAQVTEAKEYPPTVQAALLPLNRGVVPADRLDSVRKYLLAHHSELNNPYTHFFLFEELYRMDSDERDLDVLQIMRKRWAKMVEKKDPGTLIEKFEFGAGASSCHCFGAVPAYFLSAYVLGVRTEGPVRQKHLIIEPRLGDLKYAEGAVVTEHGPVPVCWKKTDDDQGLNFRFEIPTGVRATVRIPRLSRKPTLVINDKTVVTEGHATEQVQLGHRFATLNFASGKYSGTVKP